MSQQRRSRFSPAQITDVWRRWKAGQSLHDIGRAYGKPTSIRCVLLREKTSRAGSLPACRLSYDTRHPRRPKLGVARHPRESRSFPSTLHHFSKATTGFCRTPWLPAVNNPDQISQCIIGRRDWLLTLYPCVDRLPNHFRSGNPPSVGYARDALTNLCFKPQCQKATI